MFVDHIRVFANAGDGGDGAVSFRREKFVPRGGPDGGDGGRGGSVILRADPQVDNLVAFYYEPNIKAKNGASGKGRNKYGKSAEDKVVLVPVGTIVYRVPDELIQPPRNPYDDDAEGSEDDPPRARSPKAGLSTDQLEKIADLDKDGQEFVLCGGGEGGKGNTHFKSARNQVPTQYKPGGEGEQGYFYFELRKIADAGLVGYPNAGKSTLLTHISHAHPKIAPYPFTTLTPMIGVVQVGGYRRITVADIPGLIEGAHRNVGLGHDFLRHIVRCKLLLFVIDMAGAEGRNPCDDLARLREELVLYDPALAQREWVVIANKMDLPEAAENLRIFKIRFPKSEIIEISAEQNQGIDGLIQRLGELVPE
ncbi:MAG TPA: GTPase ObgE [Chthoniobacterales bacterium]